MDPICTEKESLWTTHEMEEKKFLAEVAKADHRL